MQKQLASDISRLKEDKETLTASLEDVTKEKEKLSKKLETITSEKKTVKQQEKTIHELEEKIDKLTSTNETLKKEHQKVNKDTTSSAQRSAPKDDGSNTGGHESQKETKKNLPPVILKEVSTAYITHRARDTTHGQKRDQNVLLRRRS